ncbi:helix-turn-helix domain-containing protein [Candidatus Poriferisodalis sp.]|uniref:helix-turn-helix domain-containing protein n=1 Tax=Candidatus Poriferisodalis sp. TaxID=3101277 RepID=UPI003D0A4E2E
MGTPATVDASLHARIGERLRAVRRERRLSLEDVQAASRGEFKVSVLGAYERGQRGIRVHRLVRLAEVYDVDPAELLPDWSPGAVGDHDNELRGRFPDDAVL